MLKNIDIHNINWEELFELYTREQVIHYIEDLYYRNDCYSLYHKLHSKNFKIKKSKKIIHAKEK